MHHQKFNQFLRDTIIAGLFKKKYFKISKFFKHSYASNNFV